MSAPTEAQLREVFETFDKDKNGSIDAKEIKEVCESMGIQADGDDIKDLIKQADEDGNGKIEFDEFKKAVLK